ncbi:MAG: SpaH/EbpB family LPXTG-anchored major pilin [Clostridia bacterium]|nr:SpaH/EbpB family LPXTG-anchored major pilin [Clostridia bacterium]
MKKVLALALAAVMVMALCCVAFADTDPFDAATTVNVTVNNLMAGDTLHLYKLATPSLSANNEMELTWIDDDIFIAIDGKSTETGYAPTAALQAAVAKLVADGDIDVSGDGSPKGVVADGGTSVTVAAAPGYYLALVKNGAASLAAKVIYQNMLINVLPVPDAATGKYVSSSAKTYDVKKAEETLTKTQMENGGTEYAATTVEGYKFGDYIPFKITTNIPSYPTNSKVAEFEIHDAPTGLKIVKDDTYPVTVKVGTDTVDPSDGTYSVTVTNGNLDIVFTKDYILANPGAAVEVTYSAELRGNDNNVEVDETNNKASIKYNNNPDETSYNEPDTEIKQKTFNFTILKHKAEDESTKLPGAKFSLWTAETNGEKITIVKDGDVYRPIKEGETAPNPEVLIETGANGEATVVGLGKTTYYLQEEVAPAGYKKLTSRVAAAASDTTSAVGIDYKIPNTPGQSLPETGGIGTTIFYVAGLLMVLGAGTILIARRKADAE